MNKFELWTQKAIVWWKGNTRIPTLSEQNNVVRSVVLVVFTTAKETTLFIYVVRGTEAAKAAANMHAQWVKYV